MDTEIEVLFYLSVPLFVLFFRRIGYWQGILLTYILSYGYVIWVGHLAQLHASPFYLELQRQLPGQLVYFMAGAALFYYYKLILPYMKPLLLFSLFGILCSRFLGMRLFEPVSLAVIVVYAGLVLTYIGNFGKFGDFSYGLYILHFPVLQSLIYLGLFRTNPWYGLFLSALFVGMGAFLMWHCVEKHFLRKSSHYIVVSH